MSDRDGLRRRAEVLQKVADQLSAQLRVERWSNKELRKLRGEPPALGSLEEDRLAARRFVTFASVAVLTAAAVALLVSRPWRGADVVDVVPASASIAAPPIGATIVPFTVVAAPPTVPRFIPITDLRAPQASEPSQAIDMDEIFSRPATRIELQPSSARRHHGRGLVITEDDIFGPSSRREDRHVP